MPSSLASTSARLALVAFYRELVGDPAGARHAVGTRWSTIDRAPRLAADRRDHPPRHHRCRARAPAAGPVREAPRGVGLLVVNGVILAGGEVIRGRVEIGPPSGAASTERAARPPPRPSRRPRRARLGRSLVRRAALSVTSTRSSLRRASSRLLAGFGPIAGISRSGIAIVAGLLRAASIAKDAARCSCSPRRPGVILAAGVYKLPDLIGPLGRGVRGETVVAAVFRRDRRLVLPCASSRGGSPPARCCPLPGTASSRGRCSSSVSREAADFLGLYELTGTDTSRDVRRARQQPARWPTSRWRSPLRMRLRPSAAGRACSPVMSCARPRTSGRRSSGSACCGARVTFTSAQ